MGQQFCRPTGPHSGRRYEAVRPIDGCVVLVGPVLQGAHTGVVHTPETGQVEFAPSLTINSRAEKVRCPTHLCHCP